MATLGWIGMGDIGGPMAVRLVAAGHRVLVWGRNDARLVPAISSGATRMGSPAEVAASCEAVFLCVTDDAAVEEVVFGTQGLAERWNADALVVDHSTIHPDRARQLSSRLRRERGGAWVDAPVSGGAAGARAGRLVVLAGGETADVDRARPWLSAYAARVSHLGPVGNGLLAKSCSQAVFAGTLALWAEVLSYARRNALDPDALVRCLEGSFADSEVRRHFAPHMVSGRFQSASVRPLLKDMNIVSEVARSSGAPMPISALVTAALRQQIALGHEMAGLLGLMRLYGADDPSGTGEA